MPQLRGTVRCCILQSILHRAIDRHSRYSEQHYDVDSHPSFSTSGQAFIFRLDYAVRMTAPHVLPLPERGSTLDRALPRIASPHSDRSRVARRAKRRVSTHLPDHHTYTRRSSRRMSSLHRCTPSKRARKSRNEKHPSRPVDLRRGRFRDRPLGRKVQRLHVSALRGSGKTSILIRARKRPSLLLAIAHAARLLTSTNGAGATKSDRSRRIST